MKRPTYRQFITKQISAIPYDQAFQNRDIAKAVADEFGILPRKAAPLTNVNLKRMADKGLIERYRKGTYFRTRQTAFGKARPSKELIETQLLTRRGDDIIGYETGFYLLNTLGLTTQVPKKREIATNAYRKSVDERFFAVRKPATAVNSENFRYLQLLDAITDLHKAPVDAADPEALLCNFVEKNGLDTGLALSYAKRHYPKRTLLGLVDVLTRGDANEAAQ
jgi:predicted transcriptional regulator of viral defense system